MNAPAAKVGMDFGFGRFEIAPQERMRAIRAAGFDEVMLWWGPEHNATCGTPEERFTLAQEAGLTVRTAHFPTGQTPDLWQEGAAGDAYERQLIAAVRDCGERGIENLVIHTTKKFLTPEPNLTGVRRVGHAAEAAEKYHVNLAWENTRFLRFNAFLYAHVPSPQMCFCFDAGHASCFTPGEDPLALFGSRMTTMHLHDNHGAQNGDEHLLLGLGNVDYPSVIARLKAYRPVCYNLEVRMTDRQTESGMRMEDFLAQAYEGIARLLEACPA